MLKLNKIRTKLILLLFIIIFVFTSGFIIFRQSEQARLNRLVNDNGLDKAIFFEKLLDLKCASLMTLANDYTFYDEMVLFIKTGDKKWAVENINTAMETFKTNSIWIYRTNLTVVYSVNNVNAKNLRGVPFSESSFEKLFEHNRFPHFFARTDEGLMEIVGATVHPASDYERKTSPKGYLFTGRIWSREYIDELSRLTDSTIEILPYEKDFSPVSYDYDRNVYIFSKALYDFDSSPVALMHVRSPAPVIKESIRSFNISMISLLALSFAMLVTTSFFIARWVIKPLKSISTSLETENPEFLQDVKRSKTEFNVMSVLIERFFTQRERLVEEILKHEETEKSLLDTQTRFKALFEFSPDAIYLATHEGKIVDCNPAASEMSGYSKEELSNMEACDLVTQQSIKHLSDIINMKLYSDVYFDEHFCNRKDGSVLPVELRAKSIMIDNENFFIVIVREITEKKKMQMQKELLRAQQLESLGILAGGIAHDFNNILTGIMGNISLAKMLSKPGDKISERLAIAENASLKAKDLTQQLLTFSKGGAPVKKAASIGEILTESVDFLLSGKDTKCEFNLPPGLWMVDADTGQINQVINNLIINALQAMQEKGKIDITAENAEITMENELPLTPGRYVKVSIRDNGSGIPAKHLPRIFEPYYTTKQTGSGLGLAVVYSIIKSHKGYITVESEQGKGTTFFFYLPATYDAGRGSGKPEKEISYARGKILVMDDEDIIREVIVALLKHFGCEVEYAKEGREAIELYKKAMNSKKPFDAVIMDLTVPGGMGGQETVIALLEIDPDVRAIVSSGYSNDPIMANFSEYGFKGAITKPFKPETLSNLLSSIILPKKAKNDS